MVGDGSGYGVFDAAFQDKLTTTFGAAKRNVAIGRCAGVLTHASNGGLVESRVLFGCGADDVALQRAARPAISAAEARAGTGRGT